MATKKILTSQQWVELVKTTDLSQRKVLEAFKVAMKENNAELAYELACLPQEETNRELAEKIVLRSKNPHFCYLFARDIPNANVKMHEKVCLKSKDLDTAIDFARDIPNANIQSFEKLILDARDPKYSYMFVEDVEQANIKLHQDIIIYSRNEEYIKKLRNLDYDGINKRTLSLALGRCTRSKNSAKNHEKAREDEMTK